MTCKIIIIIKKSECFLLLFFNVKRYRKLLLFLGNLLTRQRRAFLRTGPAPAAVPSHCASPSQPSLLLCRKVLALPPPANLPSASSAHALAFCISFKPKRRAGLKADFSSSKGKKEKERKKSDPKLENQQLESNQTNASLHTAAIQLRFLSSSLPHCLSCFVHPSK